MQQLSKRQRIILEAISETGPIATRDIVAAVSGKLDQTISRHTVIRDIDALLEQGLILGRGKGRGRLYVASNRQEVATPIVAVEGSDKEVIGRIFNVGTWEEWQGMCQTYSRETIREAVCNPLPGQWTPRGRALAEVLFDCALPEEALISYD